MGLPIRLAHRPTVYRGNPLLVPLRCWQDKKMTIPVDLSGFGDAWTATALDENDTSVGDLTVTPVLNEDDPPITYGLDLFLDGGTTVDLTGAFYRYRVKATGGAYSSLVVFLGSFIVEGDDPDA